MRAGPPRARRLRSPPLPPAPLHPEAERFQPFRGQRATGRGLAASPGMSSRTAALLLLSMVSSGCLVQDLSVIGNDPQTDATGVPVSASVTVTLSAVVDFSTVDATSFRLES